MPVVVIGDIVRSRALADRDRAQREIEAAFARANQDFPVAVEAIAPTTGDEFQGVFAGLEDALTMLLLVQLALPTAVGCRFGIGWGAVVPVDSSSDRIQDGSAWWSARAAIDRVRANASDKRGRVSRARSLIVVAEAERAGNEELERLANAYLVIRDQLVQRMPARTRRLLYGTWQERTQTSMAAEEGITQSAVSRALDNSGAAAILAGLDMFTGKRRSPWS